MTSACIQYREKYNCHYNHGNAKLCFRTHSNKNPGNDASKMHFAALFLGAFSDVTAIRQVGQSDYAMV